MTMRSGTRQTLMRPVALTGKGLHTGAPVHVHLEPAEPARGITFLRTDVRHAPGIPVKLASVTRAQRHTVLGVGSTSVATVEHCLAALYASRIDDVTIAVEGPELPALDGSAQPWLEAIDSAGVTVSSVAATPLRLPTALEVSDGASWYRCEPAEGLTVDVTIEWDHPLIGHQQGRWEVTPAEFARDLAPARTFGFIREAPTLAALGLARGACSENTLILDDAGLVDGDLRYPDEFVRHKALDLIGDLALLGERLVGHVTAVRPSHRSNLAFARALARLAYGVIGHGHPGDPEDPAASVPVSAR